MGEQRYQDMITLRAMEPEDLEFIYRIENDPQLWPLSSTTVPYSHHLLEDYILNSTGDVYSDKQVRLIICSDGQPIGIADLSDFNPTHRRAELGMVIAPEHRHKGYSVEALGIIEQYAITTIHLHQIYAIVPESNHASLQMLRKTGFTHEFPLKDWLFDGTTYHNAILLQKTL